MINVNKAISENIVVFVAMITNQQILALRDCVKEIKYVWIVEMIMRYYHALLRANTHVPAQMHAGSQTNVLAPHHTGSAKKHPHPACLARYSPLSARCSASEHARHAP